MPEVVLETAETSAPSPVGDGFETSEPPAGREPETSEPPVDNKHDAPQLQRQPRPQPQPATERPGEARSPRQAPSSRSNGQDGDDPENNSDTAASRRPAESKWVPWGTAEEPANRLQLQDVVIDIVNADGPIHFDDVVAKVADLYGHPPTMATPRAVGVALRAVAHGAELHWMSSKGWDVAAQQRAPARSRVRSRERLRQRRVDAHRRSGAGHPPGSDTLVTPSFVDDRRRALERDSEQAERRVRELENWAPSAIEQRALARAKSTLAECRSALARIDGHTYGR